MSLHSDEVDYYIGMLDETTQTIKALESRNDAWKKAYHKLYQEFLRHSYSIKDTVAINGMYTCVSTASIPAETATYDTLDDCIEWAEKLFIAKYPVFN